MEESVKDNRIYGFPLLIYAFFLCASIVFWILTFKGTGGESFGHLCVTMPTILVTIIYFISAILVFNEKYSKALAFTLLGLVLLLFTIPLTISAVEDNVAPLIIIFYFIIPLILFLSIGNIKTDEEDISQTYFPPPPDTL